MVIGILLGVILAFVLNIIFTEPWVKTVSWLIVLFGLVAGRVMGAVRDWRDEDWIKRSK
jgi:hypothetical protein